MISESDVLRAVSSYYRSVGYRVKTEVPLLTKRIDMVAHDDGLQKLILIETKVHDWVSAIRQASVYTLCTPDAYIAIAKRYSHRVDTNLVRSMGLGFLEVDGTVKCSLKPSGNAPIQPSVRDSVIESLRNQRGGDS